MSTDSLRKYAMLDGEQLESLWREIDELRGVLYDEQHGISFHMRNAHLQEWQEHGRCLLAAHRGQMPSEAADLYGGGCGCPQCAEVLALLKGSNMKVTGAA